MRISAVTLSRNSERHLDRCIRSLIAALPDSVEPDEIWVVENGSTDGSVEILRGLEAEFRGLVNVIYLDHNSGTTVSRNMGLRETTGRYLLIIDSDVEVPRGTLEPLMQRLDVDRDCGLVAPRLMYASGLLQMSTDVFPTFQRKLQRLFTLRRMEERNDARGWPPAPVMVDYAISAFWMFRREIYEAIGGLDENIFYTPEDTDFCIRVWEAGYKIVYDSTVYATHDAQEISRGFKVRGMFLSHSKSLFYMWRKHRYFLGRRGLYRRLNRFGHSLEPEARAAAPGAEQAAGPEGAAEETSDETAGSREGPGDVSERQRGG